MKLRLWVKIVLYLMALYDAILLYLMALYGAILLESANPMLSLIVLLVLLTPGIFIVALMATYQ